MSKLREAKLQAVLSKNIYSLQGFEARMFPSFTQVCHSLMVVSNCNPGSAHAQAAYAICSHNSEDLIVLHALGSRPSCSAFFFSVLQYKFQSWSSCKAVINSFGTRKELFAFCPATVAYASEFQSVSYSSNSIPLYPCCASCIILSI